MEQIHDHHTHIGFFNDTYYDFKDVFSVLKNNGVSETTLAYLTPKFDDKKSAVEFYYAVNEELKEAVDYAKSISLKTNILYWADPFVLKSGINFEQIFSDFDFHGFAIHPVLHDWTKSEADLLTDIFNYAHKKNLPIYIHTGIDDYDEPLQFEQWIKDFPDVEIHLAHCKATDSIIELFSKYKNLFGDTVFCPNESYKKICGAGFKDRMLFGTDFPITHWFEHIDENPKPNDYSSLFKNYQRKFVT